MKSQYVLTALLLICGMSINACENWNEDNPTNAPPFALRVVYPNGGESLRMTDTVAVSWEANGFGWDSLDHSVNLYLIKSDRKWSYIGLSSNNGLYFWIVGRNNGMNTPPIPDDDYKLRVQHTYEPGIFDNSDFTFSIY